MSRFNTIKSWTRRGAGALGLVALMMGAPGCDNSNDKPTDPPVCTDGEAGCACLDGGVCGEGLECSANNVCEGAASFGLVIADPNARACEVLLVENSGTVYGASYVDGVEGALRRRAPNVAVALARLDDSSFPETGAARLTISEDNDVRVNDSQTRCFDANGAVMSGVTVTLEQ